uniref:Uncharacterized protein n=1 Tax=Romanomermis culicivorax TaxID=13658 RepID=A0A915JQ03_ROMCU
MEGNIERGRKKKRKNIKKTNRKRIQKEINKKDEDDMNRKNQATILENQELEKVYNTPSWDIKWDQYAKGGQSFWMCHFSVDKK